jgi:hypothetical protein
MRPTGTIYFGKRASRTLAMAWRVSRPAWQTAFKINYFCQQEELI